MDSVEEKSVLQRPHRRSRASDQHMQRAGHIQPQEVSEKPYQRVSDSRIIYASPSMLWKLGGKRRETALRPTAQQLLNTVRAVDRLDVRPSAYVTQVLKNFRGNGPLVRF